jgi:hypothetical protein
MDILNLEDRLREARLKYRTEPSLGTAQAFLNLLQEVSNAHEDEIKRHSLNPKHHL